MGKNDLMIKTGADLLIQALQENGINKMYGVVGIPVTDFARLAQLRGMKYYGFRREDAAVDDWLLEAKAGSSINCFSTRLFKWTDCFSSSN